MEQPKQLDLVASLNLEAAADADGKSPLPRFSMIAYTGGLMRIAGWRYPLVVDLAGRARPAVAVASARPATYTGPVSRLGIRLHLRSHTAAASDTQIATHHARGRPQTLTVKLIHHIGVLPGTGDQMPANCMAGIAQAGVTSADVSASAVAVFGSRDIMLALDYSQSMNDDSELAAISRLGRTQVEKSIENIWRDLGSPRYGNMQFTPVYIASSSQSVIRNSLGLSTVPYPYPSGSWEDYFQYVQEDDVIEQAGYRRRYGYLTLINYWEAVRAAANQTPDLWKTREQPVTAVKDAVSLFLLFMQQEQTDDRVGLAAYTSADGQAVVEVPLTDNYALVETTSRHRQAGHYHEYTNIASGIDSARAELIARGRSSAMRMIVLLSDGKANWHENRYSLSAARAATLAQARTAAADGIPVLTISLGADADTDLMQEVADITGGHHFIVPGGKLVAQYEQQLLAIFSEIAAHRPLKLVD